MAAPTAKPTDSVVAVQGACDCHIHIYDIRYPHLAEAIYRPPDALVPDYLVMRRRLGLERAVVVTPSAYGTDNRVTLDAVRQLGPSARAVVVVSPTVSTTELRELHASGVRGVRFNLVQAGTTTAQMIVPTARRIAPFGWHVQAHVLPSQLAELAPLLANLATPVVLDHFARIPVMEPEHGLAMDALKRRLDAGNTWVKLSAPYHATRDGSYANTGYPELARELVRVAPERLVWGSDWPHPSETANPPDDLNVFETVRGWIPTAAAWTRILVDNPARLYDF